MKSFSKRLLIAFVTLAATLVVRAIDPELWRDIGWLIKAVAFALLGVE